MLTALPAANYISDNSRTEGEAKAYHELVLAHLKAVPGGSGEHVTISGGALTAKGGIVYADTEGAAATDNLQGVTTTNYPEDAVIIVFAESESRVVTVKNGAYIVIDGGDFVLDQAGKGIVLHLRADGKWYAVDFIFPTDATGKAAFRAHWGLGSITDPQFETAVVGLDQDVALPLSVRRYSNVAGSAYVGTGYDLLDENDVLRTYGHSGVIIDANDDGAHSGMFYVGLASAGGLVTDPASMQFTVDHLGNAVIGKNISAGGNLTLFAAGLGVNRIISNTYDLRLEAPTAKGVVLRSGTTDIAIADDSVVGGVFAPVVDGVSDLGLAAFQWQTLYSVDAILSGTVYAKGGLVDVGLNDSVAGALRLRGNASTTGGKASWYNGDSNQGTYTTFELQAIGASLALNATLAAGGTSSALFTFSGAGVFTATGGIVNTAIGATSPSTGAFTSLSASSTAVLAAISSSASGASSFNRDTSATNTFINTTTQRLTSSGTVVDGFGPAVAFSIAGSGLGNTDIGYFGCRRSGADNTGEFFLRTISAGSGAYSYLFSAAGCTIVPNTTISGDLGVNGGDLTSTASTFNLLNQPTTVNAFTSGNNLTMGADGTGTATYRNSTHIFGTISVYGTRMQIKGAAGSNRGLELHSGTGSLTGRWAWLVGSTAEGGSNTGSPMVFNALDDNGAYIDSPISIIRAAGGLFSTSRPFQTTNGSISAGVSDNTRGIFEAYGNNTTSAGQYYIYNAANVDDATNAWLLSATTGGDFVLFGSGGTSALGNILTVDDATGLISLLKDSTIGSTSTNLITCVGRLIHRNVNDSAMNVAGTLWELLANDYNDSPYWCRATGSPGTFWNLLGWEEFVIPQAGSNAVTQISLGSHVTKAFACGDATDDEVYFDAIVPPSYAAGAITMKVHYSLAVNGTTGDVVRLILKCGASGHAEAVNDQTDDWGSVDINVAANLNTQDLVTTWTGTPTGIQPGDRLSFRFIRKGTHANDTYSSDIYVNGLHLSYN